MERGRRGGKSGYQNEVNTEGRSVHVGCWCKNRLVGLEYEWIVSFVSYHISLYHISLYRVLQCTITFATTM